MIYITENYKKAIELLHNKGIVLNERTLLCGEEEIKIFCVKQITDLQSLSELIMKPLIMYCGTNKRINAKMTIERIIYPYDSNIEKDFNKIEDLILEGRVIILFSNDNEFISINIKKVETRQISKPDIDYAIRGPGDCFVENLETNLSLIRYRIKDPNLTIEYYQVGRRTKTNVAVIYVKDIANDTYVNAIKKKISEIDIDSIWGTGELQALIQDNNFFPLMRSIERSDWGCEVLMEGKVLILADGGPMALSAPHIFTESLIACDDRYDNKYFGLFSKLIRYLALFISLSLSSFYIAIVSFHSDMLPARFIIILAEMGQRVLFTSLIEVLIVEFIAELIRESLLRVPSKIGTAVGIVGAIIIGQAAVSAGIFSPLVLIITSLSLMASFAISDYFAAHPVRMLKFLIIIMTGFFGFYGFVVAFTFILIKLVSLDSFGVPYMAPFAPFNLYDFIRNFIFSRSYSKKRPQYLRTSDEVRGSDIKKSQ